MKTRGSKRFELEAGGVRGYAQIGYVLIQAAVTAVPALVVFKLIGNPSLVASLVAVSALIGIVPKFQLIGRLVHVRRSKTNLWYTSKTVVAEPSARRRNGKCW